MPNLVEVPKADFKGFCLQCAKDPFLCTGMLSNLRALYLTMIDQLLQVLVLIDPSDFFELQFLGHG